MHVPVMIAFLAYSSVFVMDTLFQDKVLVLSTFGKKLSSDFSTLSVTLKPVNHILRVTPLVHTTCRLRLANFINILPCRIASMLVNFASSLILFDVDPDDELAEHSF